MVYFIVQIVVVQIIVVHDISTYVSQFYCSTVGHYRY